MSNENNNGVIDFDSSTFVSGNVDNANSTNAVVPDTASNSSASNINVDDIFGTWDNSSSSTQSDIKPVSNDYNNSSVDFNNGSTSGEGSNVTPPNVFDIFGDGASEGQKDTSTSSEGGVELAMDNSELTELAMNAFAGLTSNGVSLGGQEQETDSSSIESSSDAAIQNEAVTEAPEQVASSTVPEASAVSSEPVNTPVQSGIEQAGTSLENPDYMAAFANPFANSKSNQASVSQPQIEATPVSTENGLESKNSNSVATDVQTNFVGDNVVPQAVSPEVPNLINPSLENGEIANPTNVVGDFNGFSDTNNNLDSNGLGNVTNDINSTVVNPNVVPENNGVVNDFANSNPSDVATFENQPNPALNTVPPVAPGTDNQVMPNIPDGFNNQFATSSPEVTNTPNTFNTETPVAPVSGEGSIDNQTPVNVNANVEPVATDFGSATSQGFNNDNAVNPGMGTFNTQDTVAPQVQVPNDGNVQSNVNVLPQNVASDVQIPTDFNVATSENQAPTNIGNSEAPSFDNGNMANPDMGTFNAQGSVAPQIEVPNVGNVQSDITATFQNSASDMQVPTDFNAVTLENQAQPNNTDVPNFNNGNLVTPDMGTFNAQGNVTPTVEVANGVDVQPTPAAFPQPINLENPASPDVNANNFNNQVPTDFNTSFNQGTDNQIGVNNALNNQSVNTDSNVGIVPDNGNAINAASDNTNVISPEATTNLQQALSTPASNVILDNSISVGSIPNGQVATPVVADNNQESTQVPVKKQGKVSLPVVMLIIIIAFSVGVIILRRNELMDFFQTLMKK